MTHDSKRQRLTSDDERNNDMTTPHGNTQRTIYLLAVHLPRLIN